MFNTDNHIQGEKNSPLLKKPGKPPPHSGYLCLGGLEGPKGFSDLSQDVRAQAE